MKQNLCLSNEIDLGNITLLESSILKVISFDSIDISIEDILYNLKEDIQDINMASIYKTIDFILRDGSTFQFENLVKVAASIILENQEFETYFNHKLSLEQKVI